jgi:UPF0176 protein
MQLCNTLSKEELIHQLRNNKVSLLTISFYQYTHIQNPSDFRNQLFRQWSELGVLGRTYIAKEGINAQIAVPKENFEQFRKQLYQIDFLNNVRLNIAIEESAEFSFIKLKIKVRNKILADGLSDDSFDVTKKGKHLSAADFNQLTDDPNTLLIDMRNHYESEVGHFKGAILPDVDTFRDSLSIIEEEILKGNEDRNIVMYCTGGIRCEKASAWFKHRGFKHVHQLEGGIIKYTKDAAEKGIENKFLGKNFVFDERRAERISEDILSQCHQCGKPCDTHTNCLNQACHLLFIQCDECAGKNNGCCSTDCYEVTLLPEEEQIAIRRAATKSNLVFKKGRSEKLKYKT